MKRIAIWGYFGGYGGIERMVFNFYKNMNREKVQLDFILPHDFGKIAYEDEILDMGGRVFRILYSEKESLIKSRTCWKKYFKENPEVAGIHVHANFPYAFPLVMAKKCGVPLRILHSHNSNTFKLNNKLIGKIRDRIVRKQIDNAPTVYLSCSDKASEFMFPGKDYIWIKNGIDIEKFAYNQVLREKIRKQYGIQDKEILIGVVGHLTEVKNPLYSLEVFREYLKFNENAKLAFIGIGALQEQLKEKVSSYGLEKKVLLLGAMKDTYAWYQAFDLFLLPSKFEGFPVVLAEAQTSGLPCLVSDVVTRQVNITGLVHYRSLEDSLDLWAKEIETLVKRERKDCREKMLEHGFDIKQVSKQVEEIYLRGF